MQSLKEFKKICPPFMLRYATGVFRHGRLVRYQFFARLAPEKTNWYCPCCGTRIKAFVSADYLDADHFNPERYQQARQDVLCPACMSLPRHRILASWAENNKYILSHSKILYFAPEYSMTLWMKRNGIDFTTADLNNDAELKIDIQDTGLPDEGYDVIICNHVLEHVNDYEKALREIHRIVKIGGLFICSFPMDARVDVVDEDSSICTDEERYSRFGQYNHKRVFGINADSVIASEGFGVERISGESYLYDILPVTGPADYDMNILFLCRRVL